MCEKNIHKHPTLPKGTRLLKDIGERIKYVRDEICKISRADMAIKLGISAGTIQNYENGHREPPATFVVNLALSTGVSLNWLLLGKGLITDNVSIDYEPQGNYHTLADIKDTNGNIVDLDEFVFIPRYGVKAAAGHGATITDEAPTFSMAFSRYWIENILRAYPSDLSVINVKGDSMEGILNDKDTILIDHSQTNGDGLFVLRISGDLLVKRVQVLPENRLSIISANPAYNTFNISSNYTGDDFVIIGKVVWFGRTL